jgi:hypothetical protein
MNLLCLVSDVGTQESQNHQQKYRKGPDWWFYYVLF